MGREELKLSLFSDDMILYIENLKISTPKLLELSDISGCKINVKKSTVFLHTIMKYQKKEAKKNSVSLKIPRKNIKYWVAEKFIWFFHKTLQKKT